MRVLVTGCAGFIGSHLVDSLLEDGHEVVGVDALTDNYGRERKLRNLHRALDFSDFRFECSDCADEDLAALVDGADVVFHLAAEPGVRPSWGCRFEHYVHSNIVATQRVLEAACQAGSRRFVYASSSSVYGQAGRLPVAEDAPPAPLSPYGVTKLCGEQLVRLFARTRGIDCVALRYFSVYGPRQRPDMAFHRFCAAALDGQPLELYGDGRQTRDFTYVGDVVGATRAAADADLPSASVINVGGGSSVSLADAIAAIAELADRRLEIRHGPMPAGDVRDTAASIDRARWLLGFSPRVSLRDGLARQLEALRAEQPLALR